MANGESPVDLSALSGSATAVVSPSGLAVILRGGTGMDVLHAICCEYHFNTILIIIMIIKPLVIQ